MLFEVEGNIGASGQNDRSCRRKSMVFVSEQQHKESTCGRGFFLPKKKENLLDFVQEHCGDRQGRADNMMVSLHMQRAKV